MLSPVALFPLVLLNVASSSSFGALFLCLLRLVRKPLLPPWARRGRWGKGASRNRSADSFLRLDLRIAFRSVVFRSSNRIYFVCCILAQEHFYGSHSGFTEHTRSLLTNEAIISKGIPLILSKRESVLQFSASVAQLRYRPPGITEGRGEKSRGEPFLAPLCEGGRCGAGFQNTGDSFEVLVF